MSENFINKLENFNQDNINQMKEGEQIYDSSTGKTYVKTKNGLQEKKVESKQVITEDGRFVLKG